MTKCSRAGRERRAIPHRFRVPARAVASGYAGERGVVPHRVGGAVVEFLADLKRRKLVQWALAYLAAAWAVLQALGLATDSYGWPRHIMQIAFAATALGFAITLLLAWFHGER